MGGEVRVVTVLIVFITLCLVFSIYLAQLWYPSLVLYYYVLSLFHLYEYWFHIKLSIQVLNTILPFLPLILLIRKLLSLRKIEIASNYLSISLRRYLVLLLSVSLLIFSLEPALMLTLFSPIEENIGAFIGNLQSMCGNNVTCITMGVTQYVDARLGWSYNNPMSTLKIDTMLSQTDYWLLSALHFTQAHVILWQGWGSCGEHAIATAYLLNRLGYAVRIAHFSDIDHAWAEVYVNGSWYIVDPWYIGIVYEKQYRGNIYLTPIEVLSSLEDFSGDHKVLCRYLDSDIEIDCTDEYGY
ncbi:MAG: transglutaminase domain-containing protein [Sulfolobales archaeon]